jgi:hypothetical protein
MAVARQAKTTPTSRLTLDLPEPVRAKLDALRDHTHADSLVEVVRRALAVYDFLWAEKAEGGKLVIKLEDGTEREVILL